MKRQYFTDEVWIARVNGDSTRGHMNTVLWAACRATSQNPSFCPNKPSSGTARGGPLRNNIHRLTWLCGQEVPFSREEVIVLQVCAGAVRTTMQRAPKQRPAKPTVDACDQQHGLHRLNAKKPQKASGLPMRHGVRVWSTANPHVFRQNALCKEDSSVDCRTKPWTDRTVLL
jgi:hypothetical protein